MATRMFPESVPSQPQVVLLKRERNLWIRREAELLRGGGADSAVREARTAHLVLTFALGVVQNGQRDVGSFADLTGSQR